MVFLPALLRIPQQWLQQICTHWQDANSVTEVPAPRKGLFKALVIALSSAH